MVGKRIEGPRGDKTVCMERSRERGEEEEATRRTSVVIKGEADLENSIECTR